MTGARPFVLRILDSPLGCGLTAALACLAASELGYALSFQVHDPRAAAVWPFSGVWLAALCLAPRRHWPVIVAAGGLACLVSDWLLHSVALPVAAGYAAARGLAATGGAWLLARFAGGPITLLRLQEVIALACLSAVLGSAAGGLIGAPMVLLAGGDHSFWSAWRIWSFREAVGVLVYAPLVIAWAAPAPAVEHKSAVPLSPARILEAVVLAVGLTLTMEGVYGDLLPAALAVPIFIFPFLLWAALRFGLRGGTAAIVLVAILGAWHTARGEGPYMSQSLAVGQHILRAQGTLIVVSLLVMLSAAAVAQSRAAEASLRESEARYRAVVESSFQGIVIHADDGIVFANRAAAEMFGYDRPEELIGRNIFETLVAPQDRQVLRARRDALLRGQTLSPLAAWRGVRQDGSQIWASAGGSRIVWKGHEAVVSFFADITERVEAAQAVRASEAHLRAILESEPECVKLLAADGALIDMNPAGLAMIDADSLAQVAGQCVYPLVAPEQQAEFRALVDRVFRGESGVLEFAVVGLKGTRRRLESHAAPLRAPDGTITALLAVTRDITERRAAEEERRRLEARVQQAQKLESLSVLAGGVAHDFNNLLTVILGYTSLALEQSPPESATSSMLREVKRATIQAGELSRHMLAYSGQSTLHIERLRLDMIAQETARLLQAVIAKNATLDLALAPATIEGDDTQLRQVVMNLITNAAEATSGQAGRVAVRTGVRHADAELLRSPYLPDELPAGEYAFVEVADNGCGMSAETLARLFDPFFTTKFSGRGLGLAAVLGIVKGHRGSIKVESTPGRGTLFQVFLPAASGGEASPTQVVADRPATTLTGAGWGALRSAGTILVIDDEASLRGLARQVLEGAGFSVLEAGDGHAGLLVFAQHRDRLAAVLLDLTMPRAGGLEVLAELRESHPALPIIVMSGFSGQDAAARAASLGAIGLLQKPFQPKDLLERVNQALTGRT